MFFTEVDSAIDCFKEVRTFDPYCLDNMDTYSNLLYIKEMKVELSYLAHDCESARYYNVATSCLTGNYYSLRSDHQKAVLYFQRALKLNPNYLGVWTLLGHEYMEMKNTNAAIQCYRQAIEINNLDYRAWYGLGQTYEILRLPYYGLYYYKQAHMVRPNDPRMLTALGEAFEKQEKISEAMKCYNKSRAIGDADGKALFKLAKLYDKLNETEAAADLFMEFVSKLDTFAAPPDKTCGFFAFKYLANHHLKANNLDTAYKCAQKCLQHEETAEEAKSLLRSIAQKRQPDESSSQPMECAVVLDPVPPSTRSSKFPANPAYPFATSDPDDDAFS
ncbi:cell division cycle protein 23 homolog [Diaphorina citri]|uniref:Cell division cycle protein 23 homolog n=1 Tax=Diaphorina citri TaxID=121845 RepID=A0A3Q0IMI6_DIACI|nr:cell division cycle protein 23 homolog [Diaphorina citri]